MKRDSDFWVWLSVMAVLLTLFIMSLANEVNFFSSWFGAAFLVALVVATGYIGMTLFSRRKVTSVITTPVPAGQPQGAQRRRSMGNILWFVCLASTSALLFLTTNGVLPRSPWVGAPLIVLFGVWLWYELVGSKKENVGR